MALAELLAAREQVLHVDGTTLGCENDAAFDHVLDFADIARPSIIL